MTRLTRYIASEVLKGVALTVIVLLAVSTFVDLVGQLGDVGTNDYTFAHALAFIALRLPRTVFETLPPAALIGSLLALGNLAVHRELVVMRASGVSNMQLLRAVAVPGVALVLVMVLLGESLAPSLGAYAREMRTRALADEVADAGESTWFKNGNRIWNLRREADSLRPAGVFVFDLTNDWELAQVARADSAVPGPQDWLLLNYAHTRFDDGRVEVAQHESATRPSDLSPDLLGLSFVREDLLDMPALRRYIDYLQANDLDAERYLIAYWSRIAHTLSVFVMTVLALPFVFGGLRSAGKGARLILGLVIGLGYYIATQMLESSGQVFHLDPKVVAFAPGAVLLLVAAIAFARVR